MTLLKNTFNLSIITNLILFILHIFILPLVFNEENFNEENKTLGLTLLISFLFLPYMISILSIILFKKNNKERKLKFYEILVLTSPVFIILNQNFSHLNSGLRIKFEELLLVIVCILLIYLLLSFINYQIFKKGSVNISSDFRSNKISKILFFLITSSLIIFHNYKTETKSSKNKILSDKCSDMDSYNKGKTEGVNNKLIGVDCNYYWELDKQWVENKYCFCKGFDDYNKY